jgi:HNH endonuclease
MLGLERLREVLEYNPESGLWVWLGGAGRKAKPGKIAGSLDNNGYVVIRIDRAIYKAHRLAWFYMTGAWPKTTIDHINLEPADNRWVNLREASFSQNNANRGPRGDCRSGVKGVTRSANGKRWVAHAFNKYIGTFDTIEQARDAYQEHAKQRHGEFAWLQT